MLYQHIFFDLDHTLWDFERNAAEALKEIYESFEIDLLSNCWGWEDFLKIFLKTNETLWHRYNHNQIDAATLRDTRFKIVFAQLGVEDTAIPYNLLSETYSRLTPQKTHLIPHTLEVLDYLQERYQLHIISNGFTEVQAIKLEFSGLRAYFDLVITPEAVGFKKPHRQIFDFTIENIKAERSACLMIGDSLDTDIQGAKNAELDHVFFNPQKIVHQEKIHKEIHSLRELMDWL
ncbi:MAG: YjjG family noncanonical pyrimidine nucleotidase [Microscillaceae bacterium]|nr:YjjG family noncanonical pyrimidine nucleotidase [Microscillaceae bacterium]